MRFACPCCEHLTLEERGRYDICPVCFWEDDGGRGLDEHSALNYMTLREGRENYKRIGACDPLMLDCVRSPTPDEVPTSDRLQTMTTHLKVIHTKGADELPNGIVVPIWHIDSGQKIEQVYMTSIHRGCMKGPHLHYRREGAFTVISGSVLIVYRVGSEYREILCEDTYSEFKTVRIPPGVPCALYNVGRETALVLNMPNPAWRDNSDEHPVDNWTYEVKR